MGNTGWVPASPVAGQIPYVDVVRTTWLAQRSSILEPEKFPRASVQLSSPEGLLAESAVFLIVVPAIRYLSSAV